MVVRVRLLCFHGQATRFRGTGGALHDPVFQGGACNATCDRRSRHVVWRSHFVS